MVTAGREKIGLPLDGREVWKVADVYSDGTPFKFVNPALPDYSVSRWYDNNYVIFLKGSVVRGHKNGMRLFKSAQAAAVAAEMHYADRVATVREKDGLAMSSRNAYLSPQERAAAPALHRILKSSAERIAARQPIEVVLADGRAAIAEAGFALDYLEARHAETLQPVSSPKDGAIRLLVAAKLGKTRLIDNIGV